MTQTAPAASRARARQPACGASHSACHGRRLTLMTHRRLEAASGNILRARHTGHPARQPIAIKHTRQHQHLRQQRARRLPGDGPIAEKRQPGP
jgi:hypothetical protein